MDREKSRRNRVSVCILDFLGIDQVMSIQGKMGILPLGSCRLIVYGLRNKKAYHIWKEIGGYRNNLLDSK